MSKAESLAEAKRWLRGLSVRDVDVELGRLGPQPERSDKERGEVKRKTSATVVRRFEHPHYWAGFILIGNPD